MTRIAITGANGFIGTALVHAARRAGYDVIAITREEVPLIASGITQVACDLGAETATRMLAAALAQTDAVIHAAARLSGDSDAQARDTLAATDHLVEALQGTGAKLVLVSSLSVYDVASLVDGAVLDEAAPLVRHAAQRDTYAAMKAAQESRAQNYDGRLQIVRPGAVYGQGRLWSAQLGFSKAGRIICPDGTVPVPAIHVDHAARTLIMAAAAESASEPVNLIDPDPPQQIDWITALGMPVLRVPRRAMLLAGHALGRGAPWAARFRPLRYDTHRAVAVLHHRPDRTFAEAFASARDAETAV